MAGDRTGESCVGELELLRCLQRGGSWSDISAAVADVWLRQFGCRSVTIVCAVAGGGISGLQYRRGDDDQFQAMAMQLSGGLSVFVSPRLFRQLFASAGVELKHCELFHWPDLLCGLVVESGDGLPPGAELRGLLESVSRSLLSAAAVRAVLLADPARMEALAEFAAGAGHEINNPLATIIGQAQLQLRGDAGMDLRQSLETIGAQAWRIRDMIGNTMLFARPPEPHVQPFRLRGLLDECAGALRQTAAAGVSVGSHCEGDPELTADRAQLGVLICHLLRNGCEALRGASRSGTVVVSGRAVEDCVELSVEDNGPGLSSAEVLRHAFDPFYSGRSAGRGLGFGLCVSWRIVRQHGGGICLENLPHGGVCCRISLPQRPPVL